MARNKIKIMSPDWTLQISLQLFVGKARCSVVAVVVISLVLVIVEAEASGVNLVFNLGVVDPGKEISDISK